MAQARICGVNIRIERDPNAGLYYMHIEYRKEKELPINLGKSIQPEAVYGIVVDFLEERKIKCKSKYIKYGIANLLQNIFKEMGITDEKLLDFKLFKWTRTRHK